MKRQCNGCGAAYETSEAVCPRCGTIGPDHQVSCEKHAGERAVACCVVCGKPVCGDCMTMQGSQCFCDDPAHQEVMRESELLQRVSSEFESDMIRTNLKQAGIGTSAFSRRQHLEAFWLVNRDDVKIFVPRGSAEHARSVLRSLGLTQAEHEPGGNP